MGSVFPRGNKLWLKYKTISGKWTNKPSGLNVGDEAKARDLLKRTEKKIAARVDAGERDDDGPLTVQRCADRWIETRKARGVICASDDEGRFKFHVLPSLGKVPLDQVRPRHIRDLVRRLRDGSLAPRTVRNIHGMLHTFFHDAVVEELIDTNPCVLKRGELPEKVDKDPLWRSSAVFTRDEVVQLISDERIPADRRTVYSVLFLTGVRWGEMSALKWKHYDAEAEPLGRLLIGESYSVRLRRVKGVKTRVTREVPVHPCLASILAEWNTDGWPALMGREPNPDDLIVPARREGQRTLDGRPDYAALMASTGMSQAELARRVGVSRAAVTQGLKAPARPRKNHGTFRTPSQGYSRLRDDLTKLGMRRRRVHDTRRTMITLALNDGARRDVLQGITHGHKSEIIDLYNSPLWKLKCEELAKLRIERLVGLGTALGTVSEDSEELREDTQLRMGSRLRAFSE